MKFTDLILLNFDETPGKFRQVMRNHNNFCIIRARVLSQYRQNRLEILQFSVGPKKKREME